MTLRLAVLGLLACACAAGVAGAARQAGPASLSAPAVTGTARVGSALAASPGSWSGTGVITYAYAWSRCSASGSGCAAIAGATSGAYALTAADQGDTVVVTVTAKDSTGSATRDSSVIGPIAASGALASSVRPTIAGTAAVGSQLTASAGTWTSPPTSLAYAWQRCDANGQSCAPIAGATTSTYTPTSSDAGDELVALVQATAGQSTQGVLSLATEPVTGASSTASLGVPTVTGGARVGQRLTGAPPAGLPAGATETYQWYRCDATGAHCNSIHGATAKTYTEVGKDVGDTIALTVHVTVSGTSTATYSSVLGPVAPATAATVSTVQPAITGQAIEGQTLTATAGTWSTTPTAVRYAWQRCNANGRICIAIDGATSSTYVPVAADVGHELVALVLASFGTTSASTLSLATQPVKSSVLANTSPPGVTGSLRVGQKLTGTSGAWTGSPPIAYHYQWYRCNSAGAHCSSVHGATAATYTLVAKDAGQTVGLTVTATDSSGSKPAYASLVGPVAAAAAAAYETVQPAITGSAVEGQQLSVGNGTWSSTPAAFTYQWERCNANGRICAVIAGATASSYTPTADDVGHALVVLVAGSGATALSTATLAVTPT